MLERDYIRRLIRQFFEELEKLRDKQKKNAASSTYQCEVTSMYRAYLGHPASFFYEQDAEFILQTLASELSAEQIVQRLEMLADLLYFDASGSDCSEDLKKDLWNKALFMYDYVDRHSDTFSFERRGKMTVLKEKVHESGL